ncbi:MAG: hypothetical protein ACRDGA_14235, partial [Bacteroidota bacterium]
MKHSVQQIGLPLSLPVQRKWQKERPPKSQLTRWFSNTPAVDFRAFAQALLLLKSKRAPSFS